MAVGDKQRLITTIVSEILNESAQLDKKFSWFINKHQDEHFKDSFQVIDKIYLELGGNNSLKKVQQLQCDAYFGGKYNLIFEFDEVQHFSSARLKALNNYPQYLKLNYLIGDWEKWCLTHSKKADKYRYNKITKDFNFQGGRTCQRAYLDCFRDFLPQHNGLNPTLRISEFEVEDVHNISSTSLDKVRKLIEQRLQFL